jgi:acetate kinase
MNIFVLNCGSSSLKYKMISMPSGEEIFGGEVQRIGSKTSELSRIIHLNSKIKADHKIDKPETVIKKIDGYEEAFLEVMEIVKMEADSLPDIIAHRFVHGGMEFPENKILLPEDRQKLEKVKDLAPIHNPPVIKLIIKCWSDYPEIPQAIILDTAFHSTIPEYARTYAIPDYLRDDLGIRKYGFHGISHQYVSEEAARFMNSSPERFNAVSCHLGSGGASLCAIAGGKSIDNSMGYSPLQGLVMSTRSGDLDPAIILKMLAYSTGDYEQVNTILNKKSGVLGLSGVSSDIRDIIRSVQDGANERSKRTFDVYTWRIKKYLGSYLTIVGRTDALIFTDPIGETVPIVRESLCTDMECFGIKLDKKKNDSVADFPADIGDAGSPVRILVVKTNEELAIAKRAYQLMEIAEQVKW